MATRRCSYTAALKLVEYAERHDNRSAGREFDICEKLIRDWRKKKAELQSLPGSRRSQRPGIKPYWPELEDKLNDWVLVLVCQERW